MKIKYLSFFLVLILLLTLFSGCSKSEPKTTEAVIFPTMGAYGSVIFNVPANLIDTMEYTDENPEKGPKGYLNFADQGGAYVLNISDDIQNLLYGGYSGKSSPNVIDRVGWETYFTKYLTDKYQNLKDLSFKEIEGKEGGIFDKGYEASFSYEGNSYRYIFCIGIDIYTVWFMKDKVDQEGHTKMVMSIRTSEDPEDILGKYESKEFSGDFEKDGKKLLVDMLRDYMAMDLPLQRAIMGYTINSMVEIGPQGDVASILDNRIPFEDRAPFDVIFPNVRVFKVDYSLIPYNRDWFNDFSGGGFDITEEGYKHYKARYAVFVENPYVDHEDLSKFYFLGFIHPSNLAEHGVDSSVLYMVSSWYENNIIAYAEVLHKTPFVGDAMKVGNLIMALPLREAINTEEGTFSNKAIMIQTDHEPYEVTVNYYLQGEYPDNTLKLNEVRNKDADPFFGVDLNPYIKRQIHQNIGYIFSAIENVNSVNIVVHRVKDDVEESITFKGERKDYPETVYMIRGM